MYPAFVDGEPPVILLKEYDDADWAETTCVDRRGDNFVVVVMEEPTRVVARISPSDSATMNAIFKSAHKDYAEQLKR